MKSIFVTGGNLWVVRRLFLAPVLATSKAPNSSEGPMTVTTFVSWSRLCLPGKSAFPGMDCTMEKQNDHHPKSRYPKSRQFTVIVIVMAEILHKCTKIM